MKTETPKLTLKDTTALRVIVPTPQAVFDAQSTAILIASATHLSKTRADWDCWPGLTPLARYTGRSPDTITRTRRYLVEQKLLIPPLPSPGPEDPEGRRTPSPCFEVHVEAIEALRDQDAIMMLTGSRRTLVSNGLPITSRCRPSRYRRSTTETRHGHGAPVPERVHKCVSFEGRRWSPADQLRRRTSWRAFFRAHLDGTGSTPGGRLGGPLNTGHL